MITAAIWLAWLGLFYSDLASYYLGIIHRKERHQIRSAKGMALFGQWLTTIAAVLATIGVNQ